MTPTTIHAGSHHEVERRRGRGASTTVRMIPLLALVLVVASGCSLWTFGANNIGQLGDGTTTDRSSPVEIGAASDWAAGSQSRGDFSCAIADDYSLWCWGFGTEGQLGDGTSTSSTTPVQAGPATSWLEVATGDRSTCAVRFDNTLWCWGNNTFGQNAQGTFGGGEASPVQVGAATDWKAVGAGNTHYCAVKTTGTLWCWGSNGFGQLGIGSSFGMVSTPIQAGTDTDWDNIGAGPLHNCATRTGGTLWCWGINNAGQIGDGTTTERTSPVQVGTATDWLDVSGGTWSTCGRRATGGKTAWCWGYNGAGAVGDGTTTDRLTPTQVGSTGGWGYLTTGNDHTCGVQSGELHCWGTNFDGQLGDGTTTTRHVPTQVGSATDWTLAYAGFNQTTAFRND